MINSGMRHGRVSPSQSVMAHGRYSRGRPVRGSGGLRLQEKKQSLKIPPDFDSDRFANTTPFITNSTSPSR
jgi:hypothetical protein